MAKPVKDSDKRAADRLSIDDPAKGGVKPADPKVHRSENSPKPHGDRLQHAVDEAAEKRARRF
jgi:hypothetical protein